MKYLKIFEYLVLS